MKKLSWLLITGWLFTQCSTNTSGDNPEVPSVQDPVADSTEFFPVTSFLEAQINRFDSMPVTVLQVTTTHKKHDSAWISREQVKPLLRPFTEELIDKRNLVNFFHENRFNDQSTGSVTLTYLPSISNLPDSVRLRRWVVYVHPETGQLTMVYLSRQLIRNGESFTQQLIWKTDHWAKIATISNSKDSAASSQEEIKWIWGKDH